MSAQHRNRRHASRNQSTTHQMITANQKSITSHAQSPRGPSIARLVDSLISFGHTASTLAMASGRNAIAAAMIGRPIMPSRQEFLKLDICALAPAEDRERSVARAGCRTHLTKSNDASAESRLVAVTDLVHARKRIDWLCRCCFAQLIGRRDNRPKLAGFPFIYRRSL